MATTLFRAAHFVFWLGWVFLAYAAAPPRSFWEGAFALGFSGALMAAIYCFNRTFFRMAFRWLRKNREG